MTSTLITERVY